MADAKLPDKMSELIEVAMRDFEIVAKNPLVTIDMGFWILPDNGTCRMCLAGAVMHRSLHMSLEKEIFPALLDDNETKAKLRAINLLRSGRLAEAAKHLHVSCGLKDVKITDYEDSPEDFVSGMWRLAATLAAAGL